MAMQNIYDNEQFFEGYRKHRISKVTANQLFEVPALLSLLPDLSGMNVLDLGCGFGDHCMEYIRAGAANVTGIDISEKMLETARRENNHPDIEYIHLPMEQLNQLDKTYDLVVSSLALHYVQDFEGTLQQVYRLLSDDGLFVFSQEHPLVTSKNDAFPRWTKGEDGSRAYWNLSDYGLEGLRKTQWYVDGVEKYHRTFSSIVNALIDNGFQIERILEPVASEEVLREYPMFYYLKHRPDYLLIRSRKHAL